MSDCYRKNLIRPRNAWSAISPKLSRMSRWSIARITCTATRNPPSSAQVTRAVDETASHTDLVGLPERTQVDFLGPGRWLLAMNLPIGLGDRLDAEEAALAALL